MELISHQGSGVENFEMDPKIVENLCCRLLVTSFKSLRALVNTEMCIRISQSIRNIFSN
jgi:hypothetical protein